MIHRAHGHSQGLRTRLILAYNNAAGEDLLTPPLVVASVQEAARKLQLWKGRTGYSVVLKKGPPTNDCAVCWDGKHRFFAYRRGHYLSTGTTKEEATKGRQPPYPVVAHLLLVPTRQTGSLSPRMLSAWAWSVVHTPSGIKTVSLIDRDVAAQSEQFLINKTSGWKRSWVADVHHEVKTDESRTSSTLALTPTVLRRCQPLRQTLATFRRLLGDIPPMLRIEAAAVSYAPGQTFGLHHDSASRIGDEELENNHFYRVLTGLLYLNDVPEGYGGETIFPHLDKTFRPTAGTLVLFVNFDRQGKVWSDMEHMAMPLKHGHKHILNLWLTRRL